MTNNQQTNRLGGNEQEKSAIEHEKKRLEDAILKSMQDKSQQRTEFLDIESDGYIPDAVVPAFGYRQGAAANYKVMPLIYSRTGVPEDAPIWRVELHGLASSMEPLGIDIAGDMVIGRGKSDDGPADLDLDPYGGGDLGISRRHAMLRPTSHCLYLLDLGSTNGTMLNALQLNRGVARKLAHDDVITLGAMSCTLKIIDSPLRQAAEDDIPE